MGTIYGNILAQRNTNTTYGVATQSANGLLSAADKKKLDGIATSANNYSHPTSSGNKHIPSGGSSGQILRWSADGTAVWGNDNNTTYGNMTAATASAAGKAGLVPAPAAGKQTSFLRGDGTWQTPPNTTYAVATASSNGLLSATDKTKLDRIAFNDSLYNLAIESDALRSNTSGKSNLAIGEKALYFNTTGSQNCCVGKYSLYSNTTGWFNTALGDYTLRYIATGNRNIGIGDSAGAILKGAASSNIAIGESSMTPTNDCPNQDVDGNIAIGQAALAHAEIGEYNVAIGDNAGTGNYGLSSGVQKIGSNNIFIGAYSVPKSESISNSISIGYRASANASNQITLGNTSITSLRCQKTAITALSDRRVKEDIHLADTSICLADVIRLPVNRYKYKNFTGTHIDQHVTGWLADDYEKVFPKEVQINDEVFPELDDDGNPIYETITETSTTIDPETGETIEIQETKRIAKTFVMKDVKNITPEVALPTLWGAVQELAKENEELKQKVAKMDEIEARLALLEVKLVGG